MINLLIAADWQSVPTNLSSGLVDPGLDKSESAASTSLGLFVADVNGDLQVNCTDLDIVQAAFGIKSGQPGYDIRADVNADGVVNIVDLRAVASALPAGTTCQ
jgi:hypothetical protein